MYFGTSILTYIGFSTTISFTVSLGVLLFYSFSYFFNISTYLYSLYLSPYNLLMIFSCSLHYLFLFLKCYTSTSSLCLYFSDIPSCSSSWWIFLNNFCKHSLLYDLSFSINIYISCFLRAVSTVCMDSISFFILVRSLVGTTKGTKGSTVFRTLLYFRSVSIDIE